LKSAFSLEEENGVLVPVKNTGFEIMKRFYEQHPDFGFEATFFMNGYRDAFNGAGELEDRLKYLVDSGCDIGNHTYSHTEMRPLSITEIQEELGKVDKIIRTALPDYEPVGVSYPYGSRPVEELRAYVLDGEYDGANYHYDGALSVGMSGTHSTPGNKNFDLLNIPRARGSDDAETDLWDRLRFFDENPEYKYVSDGNPKTVVVPQEYEHNIDYEYFSKTELEVIKY
jgi:peptidoglycan/xylan/chitin deacetylase (PgdA/CDA1 family)